MEKDEQWTDGGGGEDTSQSIVVRGEIEGMGTGGRTVIVGTGCEQVGKYGSPSDSTVVRG